MTPFPPIVILNGGKNVVWKRRETEQWHRVKNLLRWWHPTAFLTTTADSSHSFRMTAYHFPATSVQILHVRSGWRLTLSSLWRLAVRCHSEWMQECCLRKTGSGIVARSEESITRMTPYRLPHHGNRSFTFVQDDVLPWVPLLSDKRLLEIRHTKKESSF